MSLGIYKQGQGYWVRVMTAFGLGVMLLAACAWMWQQVGAIPLPKPTWNIAVTGATSDAGVGSLVDLVVMPSDEVIGSATVEGFESRGEGRGTVTIGQIQMIGESDPSGASRLRTGEAGSPTFGAIIDSAKGIQAFETIFLQAAVVGVMVLIGAMLTYWLVGAKRATAEFLISTDGEMKKVNWSTFKDVRGSTMVVISASFILAAGLFAVDFLFSRVMTMVGVLQQ